MKKTIFPIILIITIIASFTGGVLASNNLEKIEAWLNHEIKIEYNDIVQDLKDVNGNKIVPITYNNTTYLPVRTISNMLNVKVDWDEATKTVLLGNSMAGNPTNIIGLQPDGSYDFSYLFNEIEKTAGKENITLDETSKEYIKEGSWIGKRWDADGNIAYTFPQIQFVSSQGTGVPSEHLLNAYNAGCKALEDNGYKLIKTDEFGVKHYIYNDIEINIWNINNSNTAIAISVDTNWQACCTNK